VSSRRGGYTLSGEVTWLLRLGIGPSPRSYARSLSSFRTSAVRASIVITSFRSAPAATPTARPSSCATATTRFWRAWLAAFWAGPDAALIRPAPTGTRTAARRASGASTVRRNSGQWQADRLG